MTNKAIANLTNIHVLTPALLNVMYRQFSGDSASTVPETKLAIIQQALIQGVDMIEMMICWKTFPPIEKVNLTTTGMLSVDS